jgi:hypothetical protein
MVFHCGDDSSMHLDRLLWCDIEDDSSELLGINEHAILASTNLQYLTCVYQKILFIGTEGLVNVERGEDGEKY